jgi:hypothetical protein
MAIIVASDSIDPLHVRAVQNVLVPFVGFRDGRPDDGEESDRQTISTTMFSIPSAMNSIEDRPATVVNKICAST